MLNKYQPGQVITRTFISYSTSNKWIDNELVLTSIWVQGKE